MDKDAQLLLALSDNLRLRLLLSALPDPEPDSNWEHHYVQWWFRNRKHMRAQTPDTAA